MFHVVIPARFASSRLPGKPLLDIAGRPLIRRVWDAAVQSGAASVIVATDDARIRDVASAFGADCEMTSAVHESGTDRIAEVVKRRRFADDEIVVNLQGDEPLMPGPVIAAVAAALRSRAGCDIATAVAPMGSLDEFLDPNCVKAVRAPDGRALYFTRAPVPWPRDSVRDRVPADFAGAWRHIGLYAYSVAGLARLASLAPTPLEMTERLEQLRALENGLHIHLLALAEAPEGGVDTPQDLERVRAAFARLSTS